MSFSSWPRRAREEPLTIWQARRARAIRRVDRVRVGDHIGGGDRSADPRVWAVRHKYVFGTPRRASRPTTFADVFWIGVVFVVVLAGWAVVG